MKKKMNKMVLFLMIFLLISAASVWAGGGKEETVTTVVEDGMPKRGGSAVFQHLNTFNSMDPIIGDMGPRLVFEPLVRYWANEDGVFEIEPMLAESWEFTDGGTTLTMKLREGVKFHDGSDLNAKVVAWNIDRMVKNPISIAKSQLAELDKENPVTIVDEYTVQLNLTVSSTDILFGLANTRCTMVSMKAAENNGEEWLQLNPVGTGAFKFVRWEPGSKIELEKFADYWKMGADGMPLPYLDKLTYKVVLEVSTGITEMLAGTSDTIEGLTLDPNDYQTVSNADHIYIQEGSSYGGYRFFFNAQKPPFGDNKDLRLAVQYGIDRAAMATVMLGDFGVEHNWGSFPGMTGFSEDASHYEYDLEKAKEYLKKSGVSQPFPISVSIIGRDRDVQQAEIIQSMLNKVGFDMKVEVLERTAWIQKVKKDSDFMMAISHFDSRPNRVAGLRKFNLIEGVAGYHRGATPGLFDLIDKVAVNDDENERGKLFVEITESIYDTSWVGYMYRYMQYFPFNKRLQGVPKYILANMTYGEECWINE